MTKREFIKTYRHEISGAVARAYGENCRPTNDEERENWIANNEGLYLWAQSEGVSI